MPTMEASVANKPPGKAEMAPITVENESKNMAMD
jgi:hypothetical protein